MAVNPPNPITKRHHEELRTDTVVTAYAKSLNYFEQNRQVVFGALAVLVLIVLGAVAWAFYQENQGVVAQDALASAMRAYDAGNFQVALDGTDTQLGLLAIADEYGRTDAGNLAHFFAGDALYQLGEYERAVEHFEAYDADDTLIGASAVAGAADSHSNLGNYAEAARLYRRAASLYEDPFVAANYLLQAGLAAEQSGDFDEARELLEQVRTKYPQSQAAQNVDVYLARVGAKLAAQG